MLQMEGGIGMSHDLLVIGAGPAGWSAALQGAKLGLKVGLIEREMMLGGACVHTGTLPSKTLRHTIHQLVQMRAGAQLGITPHWNNPLSIRDLMAQKNQVVANHERTIRNFFERNGVEVIPGSASFVAPGRLRVATVNDERIVESEKTVIASGSRPRRPDSIPFDDDFICDSDSVLQIDSLPRSLCVMGAGVIGCEYASMFAALGVRVTVIDRRDNLLRFIDSDLLDVLTTSMRRSGVQFMLGEEVRAIKRVDEGRSRQVCVSLASKRTVRADRVLVAAGRDANTHSLALDKIGVEVDESGLVKVDETYQTAAPGVYAAGDVVGFPALASTSMHQGRLAVRHAAGLDTEPTRALPLALYTIPELSGVGLSENECREQGLSYEVGYARYAETPRGQILGDHEGLLKLIFHRENRKILGVHLIGQASSELVHAGMMLIQLDGTLDHILAAVFNYPTLSEAYRVAALDGLNRIR
jgi:NAD(P) transhydrogenase